MVHIIATISTSVLTTMIYTIHKVSTCVLTTMIYTTHKVSTCVLTTMIYTTHKVSTCVLIIIHIIETVSMYVLLMIHSKTNIKNIVITVTMAVPPNDLVSLSHTHTHTHVHTYTHTHAHTHTHTHNTRSQDTSYHTRPSRSPSSLRMARSVVESHLLPSSMMTTSS